MADDNLYAMAVDLLARVVTSLTAQGVVLPPLQYVAPAQLVAYDDAQLTVNIPNLINGRPGTGNAAQQQDSWSSEHCAEFQISLTRMTPGLTEQGNMPAVTDITASSAEHAKDMQALYRAMIDIRFDGLWVDNNRPFAILGVRAYGPEGYMVGSIGTLQVEVFN